MIPRIDISSLFEGRSTARVRADAKFMSAAEGVGFIQVTGFESHLDITAARRHELKRIFELPPASLKTLWRQKFAPDHANVYRGWFPLQQGHSTAKEGIDIGPDIVTGFMPVDKSDPLGELTPLPNEIELPGWHAMASRHYQAMAHLGKVIMRCLARGLKIEEGYFDPLFERGISTMRLIRYPALPNCTEPRVVGAAHIDSGLITLLLQDDVSGLEVKAGTGAFVAVPAGDDAITVNFGRLLALWSDTRIRATEHRVIGGTHARYSFPFFYEPRIDALIEPIPEASRPFRPFHYGDFLWHATTRFLEFQGMETLRVARGDSVAAAAAVGA